MAKLKQQLHYLENKSLQQKIEQNKKVQLQKNLFKSVNLTQIIKMTSKQRLLDINEQIDDQTTRIRNMNRTANQTNDTTNNIARQLGGQRQKIQNNVLMNKQIKNQIKLADKKTNQMYRRNICIKIILYFLIIMLFIAMLAILIAKVSSSNNNNNNTKLI